MANTGTGKTLSFVIPIVENLILENTGDFISTIVLAPTRELVSQIYSEIDRVVESYNKKYDNANITYESIYGGKRISSQTNRLKSNPDIVVGTPGRLIDHINRGNIDIKKVNTLVIDEADEMLLMGFRPEVDTIVSNIKSLSQVMLFSATIDTKVKKMAYKYFDEYTIIDESEKATPDTIEYVFINTTDRKKLEDLSNKISEDNPFMAIVFCRTKARVDKLELSLASLGIKCEKIHSDMSQAKRERVLKEFRNMKFPILISTNIFSRGMDIEGVTHIYNYDFPESVEEFIHRTGRTGRIDNNGIACSFVTDKNVDVYNEVKKLLNID